jgi:hypothetical protein
MTNVMNSIYGSVTKEQKKSVDKVYNELQIDKGIENLIDNNDDSFELSQNDKDALLQKANELVNGVVYYDMGCGLMGASLPMSGMTNVISQISGSTDPHAVGNAVEATVDQSTVNVQPTANENKQTVKDGFFQRLIKLIALMLTKATTTSPQIKAILALVSAFQNNGTPTTDDGLNDLKNNKTMISCLVKEAMKLIVEYIFKLVVTYMVAFRASIIKKIIMEKINQYIGVIKSLIA